MAFADDFLPAERALAAPARRLDTRGWAQAYRVLTRRQSPFTGLWHGGIEPTLDGLMQLYGDPRIEELTIRKHAQGGVSESVRNFIARQAHQDPDPMLLVLPDEKLGRRIFAKRILPLFEDTPVLARLLPPAAATSGDASTRNIYLTNGFMLNLAWSGSAGTLKADPIRYVINDEVEAFQDLSQDPIELGEVRMRVYAGRCQMINLSSPGLPEGLISVRYELATTKLEFHFPCPHCRTYQGLRFQQIKWPGKLEGEDSLLQADRIQTGKLAWYECGECHGRIEETQRAALLRQWRWGRRSAEGAADETYGVDPPDAAGYCRRRCPVSLRTAVQTWAANSPRLSWSAIAAKFLRSKGSPETLKAFTNDWLGEPFAQQIAALTAEIFTRKADGMHAAGCVPAWASRLIASVDTQKTHFYYVVRAWGVTGASGPRSRRIEHGVCGTFAELRERLLNRTWPTEDGEQMALHRLAIDSGGGRTARADEELTDAELTAATRTEEVYRFALSDRLRILPVKGESRPQREKSRLRAIRYESPRIDPKTGRPALIEIMLLLIDTEHYKDLLAAAISARITLAGPAGGTEIDQWELSGPHDPDYAAQMNAEEKTLIRVRGRQILRWTRRPGGGANHYWDCEVYNYAMALRDQLLLMPRVKRAPAAPRRVDRDVERGRPAVRRQYE